MENRKFRKAQSSRKFIAIVLTMVFHLTLLAGLVVASSGENDSFVKDIKEWIAPSEDLVAEDVPDKV